MKRFCLSLVSAGFGLMLVVISAVAIAQDQIAGEFDADTVVEDQADLIDDASGSAQLESLLLAPGVAQEYYLAYPGLLPDRPLYVFKMFRDKVRLVFANTPAKKLDLQLLYADKRIGAAEVLVSGGKSELGIDTAVKSQGYLSQAVSSAEALDDQNRWQHLASSAYKHFLILESIKEKVEAGDLTRIEGVLDTNRQLREAIYNQLDISEEEIPGVVQGIEIEEITPAEFGR